MNLPVFGVCRFALVDSLLFLVCLWDSPTHSKYTVSSQEDKKEEEKGQLNNKGFEPAELLSWSMCSRMSTSCFPGSFRLVFVPSSQLLAKTKSENSVDSFMKITKLYLVVPLCNQGANIVLFIRCCFPLSTHCCFDTFSIFLRYLGEDKSRNTIQLRWYFFRSRQLQHKNNIFMKSILRYFWKSTICMTLPFHSIKHFHRRHADKCLQYCVLFMSLN